RARLCAAGEMDRTVDGGGLAGFGIGLEAHRTVHGARVGNRVACRDVNGTIDAVYASRDGEWQQQQGDDVCAKTCVAHGSLVRVVVGSVGRNDRASTSV